jgi:cyclopentanol dehydrogenase
MKRLLNKVAIITGAAGGMGAAMAKLFASEGAKVMATDVQSEKLALWVEDAKQSGISIEHMTHDVTSEADWQKVTEKTLTLYGRLDILINNAGVYPGYITTEGTTKEQWDKVIAINLTGPFLGCHICIPHIRKSGSGSIVNISSIAGLVGGNGPAYSASKGGLTLLTKDLAVELAKDKIRVNSIHPGGVLTPMTEDMFKTEAGNEIMKTLCPLGRIGNAMEIAYGALYLASDESTYTTGSELVIDGGLVAR